MADEVPTPDQGEEAAPAAPPPTPASPAGSGLELRDLTKVFAGGVVAVDDVNLTIEHGEYVVLLGPSGCGKTTTLRMIGGHEQPTSGEILLDGESLAGLPPDKRPTTTVFQHFALFPHRSVVENVEFGLKMHGAPKEERRRRAMETLEMVGLSQLADRKPRALSGGQQQRVALARVLVTSPKALLLDEPLGDLDRLLQLRMRVELRNLQRQLGLMFIHVTHNQEESLSMADRIVVMHEGRIQQVADPLTISTRPENELVASFMGDNNIIRGKVASRDGDLLIVDDGHVKASVRAPGSNLEVGSAASVAVRAAAVHVHDDGAGANGELNTATPEIVFVEYLGDLVKLHLTLGGERLIAKVTGDRFPELRGREGTTIRISWDEADVRLLGA
jgi:ABC-type Fe3+/spermidine/putrescine transport system ATPase subunit